MENFWNIKLSVYTLNNKYEKTFIYQNIDWQLYKARWNIKWNLAENTVIEKTHIIINWDKINVRKWYNVTFINKFWIEEIFKIEEMNYQDFKTQKPLIDLELTQV